MDQIKELLAAKFEEIFSRIVRVLNQLDDEQVNWRPNNSSNSIANLIIHIDGNIRERISQGINRKEYTRNRDREFEASLRIPRSELLELTRSAFSEVIETTRTISVDRLIQTQKVRGKERTNLDILFQSAAHFSEHLGQILYIGKLLLDENYVTTSIPKKKDDT